MPPLAPDILSYETPSVIKRARMRFLLAVLANIILLVDSFVAGMLLFTLLTASIAVLTLPLNATIFLLWRAKLKMGSYLVIIHTLALFLFTVFFGLIAMFGREHFEWLLDWG